MLGSRVCTRWWLYCSGSTGHRSVNKRRGEETEKMKNQEEKTNKIVDTHTCFVLGEDLLVCFAIDSFAVGSGRENREE